MVLRYAVSSICNCIDHNGPPRDLLLTVRVVEWYRCNFDWHCGECRIVGYRWKATKGKTTARPSDGVLCGPLECNAKEGFYQTLFIHAVEKRIVHDTVEIECLIRRR